MNYYYDKDPVWRTRTVEFLSQRMDELSEQLESENWEHKPPGCHHMYMETDEFYFPGYNDFKALENPLQWEQLRQRKATRLIRLAKLFNRYQDQYCGSVGLIIN